MVSPKKASKARVAAYQKTMEEVTKVVAEAAANAAAEVAPEEPGRPGEPVVMSQMRARVRAMMRVYMLPLRRRLR